MVDRLDWLPIAQVHEPWILLRPVVTDCVDYLELRDSIRRSGLILPICVRPSSRQPGDYEVVDGMRRYTVSKEIRSERMPCLIKHEVSDNEVLSLQLQANAVHAETRPIEYSRQLRRILETSPGMTMAELAHLAGKSPVWIREMLNLLRLSKDIQLKVDRGDIPAQSAYMLRKIPVRWRKDYTDMAVVMPSNEFCRLAAGVVKRFKEAKAQGKLDERYVLEWQPRAHMRGIKDVKSELDKPCFGATLLATEGCKTVLDGFYTALKWVLHLDTVSIKAERLKIERQARASEAQELEDDANEVDEVDDDDPA